MSARGHLAEYLSGEFESLGRLGYQVIRNVVADPDGHRHAIEAEAKTWKCALDTTPLLQQYGAGQWNSVWKARIATRATWELLFRTEKLVSSWDGLSVVPTAKQLTCVRALNEHGEPNWMHRDQRRANDNLADTIQGFVALSDVDARSYGTVLYVPKDMTAQTFLDTFHTRFYRRVTRSGRPAPFLADEDDYHAFDEDELEFIRKHCTLTRPMLRKGDMLLWCSPMPHAAAPAIDVSSETPRRFGLFVSMFPKELLDPDHLHTRRDLARRPLTSSHNVLHPRLFPFTLNDVVAIRRPSFEYEADVEVQRKRLIG